MVVFMFNNGIWSQGLWSDNTCSPGDGLLIIRAPALEIKFKEVKK